jgi:glyoxylase-like metal-dependent hydrolase (beta-lactamase superfamily II)
MVAVKAIYGRNQSPSGTERNVAQQIPLDPAIEAGIYKDDGTKEIAGDLAFKRLGLVNVVFCGKPDAGDRNWVLIDAGLIGTAGLIAGAAEARFGKEARPAAIIMTHGHFDHIGALKELAARWDVPIYAHRLELPYLNGAQSYPPPDAMAGGGLMSLMAPLYPRGPIDVSQWLKALPEDGSGSGDVPSMPGWRWLHTPGHAPGHVSFWREADRSLIAGDAFITTAQESVYAVMTQEAEMHGPPMYYTPDWVAAEASVQKLAALQPELAVTGHGQAMQGEAMRSALKRLAREFRGIAVPSHLRDAGDHAV